MAIFWLALAALFVVVEMSLGTFYMLMLAGGALAALISSFTGISMWAQGSAFVLVSFLLYVFLLPILRKLLPPEREVIPAATDGLAGETAIVTKEIVPGRGGQVKVNSDLWTAFADDFIPRGERVTVLDVKVSKLYVRKG